MHVFDESLRVIQRGIIALCKNNAKSETDGLNVRKKGEGFSFTSDCYLDIIPKLID